MKKSQNNNHNTQIQEISKSCTADYLLHNDAFRFFPEKEEWRKRLIFTLYKWAESEQSEDPVTGIKKKHVDIVQFCMEHRISRRNLYYWRDKYGDIKAALDDVKIMLGCRRRVGALVKDFDKDVVFRDMHIYDPEWLEINKYHAALKREEGVDSGIRIVELQPAPNTGKIKIKEDTCDES